MASKPQLTGPTRPASEAEVALADYRPVTGQRTRHDGWTAERQGTFLTVLAETGCISEACGQAGVSSRPAYRLRQRAWSNAYHGSATTPEPLVPCLLSSYSGIG